MSTRPRRSVFWSWCWRSAYRLLRTFEPALRQAWCDGVLGITAELTVPGRSNRVARQVLVGLITLDGVWYVGHPDGEAGWVRDLTEAGSAVIRPRAGEGLSVRAKRLPMGPERSAVIRATSRQQPWPGSLLYLASRSHIEAVGSYFRLELEPEVSPKVG